MCETYPLITFWFLFMHLVSHAVILSCIPFMLASIATVHQVITTFFVLGRQLWTLGTYWTSKIGRTLPLGPSAAILCNWLTLIMCSWGNSNISNNFRARLTSWRTFWFICVPWAGCMYQNNKTNALYISDSFNILPLQHDWATPWALALDSCHLSNTTLEIMLLFREENYYYYSYNEDVRNLPHNIATYR